MKSEEDTLEDHLSFQSMTKHPMTLKYCSINIYCLPHGVVAYNKTKIGVCLCSCSELNPYFCKESVAVIFVLLLVLKILLSVALIYVLLLIVQILLNSIKYLSKGTSIKYPLNSIY